MDLRFVLPELHALDDTPAEVCACGMWQDERPLRGLAGLLDWRLAGRVSRLARQSFAVGTMAEVVCIQGRPRLPFEKVLFIGCGPTAGFDDARFREAATVLLRTLEGLKVRRAVVELPGRGRDAIAPERAAEIVLEIARDAEAHDAWWLVEPPEAQAKIASRATEERRRGQKSQRG
jgi:hypothetical protein